MRSGVERLVNFGLEGCEGLRANHRYTVDQEGRRAADGELPGELLIGLDHRLKPGIGVVAAEAGEFEADLPRVVLQITVLEPFLILKEEVVVWPELPLGGGPPSRRSRQDRRAC